MVVTFYRFLPAESDNHGLAGRAWLGVAGVTALIFVAGGPVALAVPLLVGLAWLLPRPAARDWMPWVAFGGMVASGLLSAVRPFGEGLFGPFGWPAQACALVALAAALTPVAAVPARRRAAARGTSAGPKAQTGREEGR
jgi:hypothetical protein